MPERAAQERPERPAIPAVSRARWGEGVVVCWHPDHDGWAFHHRDYTHQGPTEPEMFDD